MVFTATYYSLKRTAFLRLCGLKGDYLLIIFLGSVLLGYFSFVSFSLTIINNQLFCFFPPPIPAFFKAAFRTLTLLVFPPCFLFVSSHLTSIWPSFFFIHCSVHPLAPFDLPLPGEVLFYVQYLYQENMCISLLLKSDVCGQFPGKCFIFILLVVQYMDYNKITIKGIQWRYKNGVV